MAISYILVAIIQMRIDGLLPTSLYVTVAFVSLEFTIFEMIKNLGSYLLHGINELNEMNETFAELFMRSIKTYSKFTVLGEDIKEYENAIVSLQNNIKSNKNEKEHEY